MPSDTTLHDINSGKVKQCREMLAKYEALEKKLEEEFQKDPHGNGSIPNGRQQVVKRLDF